MDDDFSDYEPNENDAETFELNALNSDDELADDDDTDDDEEGDDRDTDLDDSETADRERALERHDPFDAD